MLQHPYYGSSYLFRHLHHVVHYVSEYERESAHNFSKKFIRYAFTMSTVLSCI